MTVYLSSPVTQQQGDYVTGMPVLLSFAVFRNRPFIRRYAPAFRRLLIDSGAFSELNSGVKVDLDEYADWAGQWPWADAVAALDDISGDWERGLANWRRYPEMFPTYHDSDPPEALEILLSYRPKWLGLGMVPGPGGQRSNEAWLRQTLERLSEPECRHLHIHGWALRAYTQYPRLDSVDSTDWFRAAQKLQGQLSWLTPGECLELIVKRYQRETRRVLAPCDSEQRELAL